MAENSAIARPYAHAIFELASESGQLKQWSDALHAAGVAVDNAELSALIGAPGVNLDQIVGLLAEVIGMVAADADSAKVNNLLRLLAENGRLRALPEIAAAFDTLKAEIENRVEVTLVAASPVDEAQQAKIIEALKKRFGKDVSLKFQLDENLIGGARLQADDLVIDGSVSSGLAKLATTLTN
jgi:F-type H+-transporting ATPase subunit delta